MTESEAWAVAGGIWRRLYISNKILKKCFAIAFENANDLESYGYLMK